VNQGYHEYENHIVTSIDGQPVRSMRDLVGLTEQGTSRFFTVGVSDGQRIVLERAKARARTPAILDRYNVRYDRSEDLRRRSPKRKR